MIIRITHWGNCLALNESLQIYYKQSPDDMGLKGNFIDGFSIEDRKKFLLAVIKYGIEFREDTPIWIKMKFPDEL